MDLLLDKNELIWAAGLSLALVYFVATYVRLRYCERHVTEYGRLILQTYGRDMHVVPESVLRYYRQDVGAYRSEAVVSVCFSPFGGGLAVGSGSCAGFRGGVSEAPASRVWAHSPSCRRAETLLLCLEHEVQRGFR